jgi:flagellar export protein FliJ
VAKHLKNLIRLHDWKVEEKQRALADLLNGLAALEAKLRKLEDDLVRERKAASEAPGEIGIYYGNFAKAALVRRRALEQGIAETGVQVAEARDYLREAYRELKKYEVAQAHRDARQVAERDHREQLFLDEIGIQAFARKKSKRPAAS